MKIDTLSPRRKGEIIPVATVTGADKAGPPIASVACAASRSPENPIWRERLQEPADFARKRHV